jgi:DNA invertase Pin-like site-specific DNA recombinase
VFQVTGAFAEFERSIIRHLVKAGLKRAVARARLGRPKVEIFLEHKAQKQLKKGVGILKVAKMLGLGTGTVQRIKQTNASRTSRRLTDLTARCALSHP